MRKFKKILNYSYRNIAAPKILSIKYRKILAKNKELKNIHNGKRCFIIAGGPSVNELDLSKLKNEFTFVVSEFDKNPQYQSLNPKFHIFSDSTYYNEGESKYWNERFKEKNKTVSTVTKIFVNLGAKSFIKKHNLFLRHKVYYIGTQGIMSENFPFNIEIEKFLPWPKNTVLLCLILAVYMGFEEIYLLGCEHNFLCYNIGKGKDISYGAAETAVPRDLNMTYEDNVAHILQLFRNYRLLYGKIKKTCSDVKIFNTTPNSYLDVFPTIKFEDITL